MKLFFRIVGSLATGAVLFFYSDLIYAPARLPERTLTAYLGSYLAYCVLAHVFLTLLRVFRVRDGWSLFLAGAVFGWLADGALSTYLYENPPFHLAWRGLCWHALLSVLFGWYYMRLVMLRHGPHQTALYALAIGVAWAFWAAWRWLETGAWIPERRFAASAYVYTAVLAAGYWLASKASAEAYAPGRVERYVSGAAVAAWFAVFVLPAKPYAPAILAPLLLVALAGLRKSASARPQSGVLAAVDGAIEPLHFLALFAMPTAAALAYVALHRLEVAFPMQTFLSVTTHLVAVFAFALSLAHALQRRPPEAPREPGP